MEGLIGVATSDKNGLMYKDLVYKKVEISSGKILHLNFSYTAKIIIDMIFTTSNKSIWAKGVIDNWNERSVRITTSDPDNIKRFIKYKIEGDFLNMYISDDNVNGFYFYIYSMTGARYTTEFISEMPSDVKDVIVN